MYRYIVFALLACSMHANADLAQIDIANNNQQLNLFLISLVALEVIESVENDDLELAETLCSGTNGSNCMFISSVGEAICKAGGAPGCHSSITIAEVICKAGGAPGCHSSLRIPEAICKASGAPGCHSSLKIPEAICKAGAVPGCHSSLRIAEAICKAGGASGCHSSLTIIEAICKAGGATGCSSPTTPSEAICKTGGGRSNCNFVTSIEDVIQRLNNLINTANDTEWDWDQFYDQFGSLQWRCRGLQTGEFAIDSECAFKFKTDQRWPNK